MHVVGHSLGAALSLYFAHAYPMQVDRLVLVDAAGILLKSVFAQHIVSAQPPTVGVAPLDPLLRGLVDRVNSFRRNLFSKLDDGFDVSRWLAQNPDIRHALLGRFAQVEAAHALIEHDFTVAIRETTAPTTVIWGANDRVAPLRTGTLLAGRMPNARLKVMEGVGHAPMLESPDDFVSLLFEALTVHVPQRQVERADGPSRGTVVCENRTHVYYSGVFDTITLDRCDSVRIAGARIDSLVVRASSLTIENSSIHSSNVALTAESSEVTATNVTIQGRVGIRASFSRLDLAGVSVMATERGIELPGPGRLLFSVSDLSAPDFNGDAHFQWPASQFNRPGN